MPQNTVHIRVSHLRGLRRCDVCGALWSFLEEIDVAEAITARPSRCCRASATLLEDTVLAVLEIVPGVDVGPRPRPEASPPS